MPAEISKREVLGLGGVGAAMLFLANSANAQQGESLQFTPEQIRQIHNQYVAEQRRLTTDRQPFNRDNLVRLVDELAATGLITSVQRDLLVQLIEIAFSSETRGQLQSRVEEAINATAAALEGVTAVIVEIYRSSISLAQDVLADVDWPSVRVAILKDLGGAVSGATVAGPFGPQATLIAILFCGTVVSAFGYSEAGSA